ncbi:MAG TPA: PepSY domain-containing protein [Devosia sp.]|jgi:hypothetical protein|nr:PepSY domain-containing protein [Devosia sp.]
MLIKTLTTTAACLLLTTAAIAQVEITPDEFTAADEAAARMYGGVYGDAPPTYMSTSDAIDRIQAMGYTGIHDLDVEWGVYEVEAIAPNGNEVEIEFDPVTGAILEVSDNWL